MQAYEQLKMVVQNSSKVNREHAHICSSVTWTWLDHTEWSHYYMITLAFRLLVLWNEEVFCLSEHSLIAKNDQEVGISCLYLIILYKYYRVVYVLSGKPIIQLNVIYFRFWSKGASLSKLFFCHRSFIKTSFNLRFCRKFGRKKCVG